MYIEREKDQITLKVRGTSDSYPSFFSFNRIDKDELVSITLKK